MEIKKLTSIKKRKSVKLVNIESQDDIKAHLYDIGLTPGTEIELLEVSPFSGPISLKIRGTKIALRQQEADTIFVR